MTSIPALGQSIQSAEGRVALPGQDWGYAAVQSREGVPHCDGMRRPPQCGTPARHTTARAAYPPTRRTRSWTHECASYPGGHSGPATFDFNHVKEARMQNSLIHQCIY